jgi:hypothetical protein
MKVKTPGNRLVSLLALTACLMITLAVEAHPTPFQQIQQIVLVRGKIERQGRPNYPAAYVPVELSREIDELRGSSSKRGFLAYTGPDGLYYFRVAPGKYVLKIKISDKESKRYKIEVKDRKSVEVGVIVIP